MALTRLGPLGASNVTATSLITSASRVATATVTSGGSTVTPSTGFPSPSRTITGARPPPVAGAMATARCTESSTWLRPVSVTLGGLAEASSRALGGRWPVSATCTAKELEVIDSRKPMTSAGSTLSTSIS